MFATQSSLTNPSDYLIGKKSIHNKLENAGNAADPMLDQLINVKEVALSRVLL